MFSRDMTIAGFDDALFDAMQKKWHAKKPTSN